ncbi:MAG: ATP-binding protein [Myxococcales bacterium]|nr:ATP-binding protein [Myxococcales bacterium]MCB9519990.1 ATP-binding protein [Myxococcales bacterium]MCB9532428.1 ATP-binding protein [Myxococcales bacterium]MCB9534349.1 ATP-binding protein [Myxococcales bacterium]
MRAIRFGLENFRSFRDRSELSFVATALSDEPQYVIADAGSHAGILPAVAVFGANASGKSNLLQAVIAFREHLEHSFQRGPTAQLPMTSWRLSEDRPTTLFMDFEVDRIHHQYGFSFSRAGYATEWLHRWPTRQRQVVYERDAAEDPPFYFGPSLRGEKKKIAEATRANALFLSTAAQFNQEELLPIHESLVQGIRPAREIQLSGFPLFHRDKSPILQPESHDRVRGFLQAVDLGVEEFTEYTPKSTSPSVAQLEGLAPDVRRAVEEELQLAAEFARGVQLLRTDADGETWTVPPMHESAGTNALLARIDDMLALGEGLLVVDELDASLHPDVCKLLVAQFTRAAANTLGAQLLFTTHDRALLGELRRDEIVLVDKDANGASSLRTLSDFRGIRGRDDRRKLHEEGRLGGVPMLVDRGGLLG